LSIWGPLGVAIGIVGLIDKQMLLAVQHVAPNWSLSTTTALTAKSHGGI